jgi:lipoate-protein ligase B
LWKSKEESWEKINKMKIINLGEKDYKEALDIQMSHVSKLLEDKEGHEHLIICSHPPVVTLGRKTEKEDIGSWSGKTYEISRGGRATYHGPGQVVVYPIVNLSKRNNDIYKYLRQIERAMVLTLASYGVKAIGDPESTGVWVNNKKIASIGIAIKNWVTYHGLAINLYNDPLAFTGINPCGMSQDTMITLEALINRKVDRGEFENALAENLRSLL